ncbi:MAG TPA: hypothetical protein VIP11_00835 [Gemmatimonadaceae bacterium]
MTIRTSTRVLAVAAMVVATPAFAQESLLPTTSWGFAPMASAWHFSTPLAQGAGAITDVMQFALPLRARTVIGERWTFDVTGAAATSSMKVGAGDSSRTLTLAGNTDVKLRVSRAFRDDRLLLTAGFNLPVGTTGLDGDQTSVLQMVGAPALGMPVGALGVGPGLTLGAAQAFETGSWSIAFGGSVERRTEYTPISLALVGGNSLTKIAPGTAAHVTFGADRPVGQNRLALLLVADAYTKDQVTVTSGSDAPATTAYTLGPQVSALARYDVAATGWREAGSTLSLRYRSAFTDAAGTKVSGSDAAYVEGSIMGVRGGATGVGLVLGADARYHGGMSFTDALVGAAVRSAGATIGVELPSARFMSRIAARGQFGQFNTGTTSSNGMGVSLIFAIAARRAAP